MRVCMVGWSHTRFGRLPDDDLESLIVRATRDVLADAGVAARDVDAIFVGNFNAGMAPDHFISSLPLQASADLRFTPATRLENACASGSAALYAAIDAILAGKVRFALVVGAEKMTGVSNAEVTTALASASYTREEADRGLTFPAIFAQLARHYFERYGDHSATLARIAAKNHHNGALNPYAHIRKDLGFAFCNTVSEKNPLIAPPLRMTDCSTIADGAAAILLTDAETAATLPKAVGFRAAAQVNDFLPMSRRDVIEFEAPQLAWQRAFVQAGVGLYDLSLAEIHDCFTIVELLVYEAIGLAPHGQGARVIEEGWSAINGRLPINPSGGLKAKGHPIGASGVSMHVMAAMQLLGEAGAIQVPNAQLAGVFNMGGAAVANYVSILEPVRR
jgi:acetyl-CoA C-acetyltransferase